MDMDLDIKIMKLTVEIKPIVNLKNPNLKAFVNLIFRSDVGNINLRGGTIKLKPFGPNSTQILTFDGPAYGSNGHFNKVFFIDNSPLYKQISDFAVKKYCELTGEVHDEVITEEVDINDLPI